MFPCLARAACRDSGAQVLTVAELPERGRHASRRRGAARACRRGAPHKCHCDGRGSDSERRHSSGVPRRSASEISGIQRLRGRRRGPHGHSGESGTTRPPRAPDARA